MLNCKFLKCDSCVYTGKDTNEIILISYLKALQFKPLNKVQFLLYKTVCISPPSERLGCMHANTKNVSTEQNGTKKTYIYIY